MRYLRIETSRPRPSLARKLRLQFIREKKHKVSVRAYRISKEKRPEGRQGRKR